jgi:outer membrane protein
VLSRQLEATRARFEVGEVTRTDIAQAEARLAGAKAALAGAQSQLDISRSAYARVVGQPPGALASPPTTPTLPASLDTALATARESSPSILAAKAAVDAARAGVKLADADFRPTASIGLSADTNVADLSDWDLQRSGGLSASARVTVPLFTNGLTRSSARQARENETSARIRTRSAEMDVEQRVANAWNGLSASRAVIQASREQVRAAEIALEGARNELEVGSRTTLDVLNQEQELLEARLALATAERDAFVAAHSVLQAMGALTPEVYQVEAARVDSKQADAFSADKVEIIDDLARAFASDPAAVEPRIGEE